MTRPRLEVAEVIRSCRRRVPRRVRRRALARATPRPRRPGRLPHGGPGRARPGVRPSAGTSRSPTTRAATATAPSARPPPRRGGWRPRPPSCSPSRTSTSSSRSRRPSARSPCTTPGSSTACCSGPPRRPCSQMAADPEHLGAEIGFLAVLHTWGQNLQHHPHVHCVVPGGGLSPDGSRWVACRDDFFLPVRVLSRVFRGKFLAGLRAAFERGRLRFRGRLARLADAGRVRPPARRGGPDRLGRLRQAAVRRPGARC